MTPATSQINYLEANAQSLKLLLDSGRCTSVDLVCRYLKRIERDNTNGATIRAIIEVDSHVKLTELAQQLDAEREAGKTRGPLHGIPIVVKDNIAVCGSMKTTSGSRALKNTVVANDSTVVAQVGRSCYHDYTHTPWTILHTDWDSLVLPKRPVLIFAFRPLAQKIWLNYLGKGEPFEPMEYYPMRSLVQVVLAYRRSLPDLFVSQLISKPKRYMLIILRGQKDPSGSSSGSVSAIAAGFVPLAIGTETDGSLICPSSRTGIWAMKPTVGLISRAGIIPVSHNQDSAGPMAKTVADVALLLNALVGPDERDPASVKAAEGVKPDYMKFLTKSFDGLRIGLMSPEYFFDKKNIPYGATEIIERTLSALKSMEEAGAVIRNPVQLPTLSEMLDFNPSDVQHLDFKCGLEEYLAGLESMNIHNLEELIQYNNNYPQPGYESQCTFLEVMEWSKKDPHAHDEALKRQIKLSQVNGIDACLEDNNIYVLLVPSDSKKATRIAAMAGYPIANMPLGVQSNGLPFGLAIFAGKFREDLLLQAMSTFEDLFPKIAVPKNFKEDAFWPPLPAENRR